MKFTKLSIKTTKKHSRLLTDKERKITMKKYLAVIFTFVLILTLFTACKPKLKGGFIISDSKESYAAVTNEDGGIKRDEAGNLVVLVTDKNGRNVKDDNGELMTNAVAIERPIVLGRRIECPDYAINIPDGWSDYETSSDLIIRRDGTEDQIKIITAGDKKFDEVVQGSQAYIDNMMKLASNVVHENKAVKVGEKDAHYVSGFAPDVGGKQVFMGYIFFEHNNTTFSVALNSDRNFGENLDEILSILNTIEFIL